MGELTAKTRGPFSASLFPFDLTSDSFSNEGFLSRNFQELTVGRSQSEKDTLKLFRRIFNKNLQADHSEIHKIYIANANNEMGNHIKIQPCFLIITNFSQ